MIVNGFEFSGVCAGIKKNNKKDLALIYSERPFSVAGVFTSSSVKAAPVVLDMEHIKKGISRAILINSGNANACTGAAGMSDALICADALANTLDISADDVLLGSTGVIGERLPVDKITGAIPALMDSLSPEGLPDAAEAIMTTDLFEKIASASGCVDGKEIVVAGFAKGAGMIAPNMATMLAYVCTDAKVEPALLQKLLKQAVDVSFNNITVDGDMSTNDTVFAMASGASGVEIKEESTAASALLAMMKEAMIALAKKIVTDGEGATKLIEICVKGASTLADAKKVAMKIANSPLVKTAFYGQDANWGRIAMALGASGATFDMTRFDLFFDEIQLVKNGLYTDKKAEDAATDVLKKNEIQLTLNLNAGTQGATVWTCDLTHDYIKINAEYRS